VEILAGIVTLRDEPTQLLQLEDHAEAKIEERVAKSVERIQFRAVAL
jgi:Zn-dependent oligopeptidase